MLQTVLVEPSFFKICVKLCKTHLEVLPSHKLLTASMSYDDTKAFSDTVPLAPFVFDSSREFISVNYNRIAADLEKHGGYEKIMSKIREDAMDRLSKEKLDFHHLPIFMDEKVKDKICSINRLHIEPTQREYQIGEWIAKTQPNFEKEMEKQIEEMTALLEIRYEHGDYTQYHVVRTETLHRFFGVKRLLSIARFFSGKYDVYNLHVDLMVQQGHYGIGCHVLYGGIKVKIGREASPWPQTTDQKT